MTELHKSINEGHGMIGKGMQGLAKMMGELSGKTPPAGKDTPPVFEPEKTEKSAQPDLSALFTTFKSDLLEEVKKSMAPALARMTAIGLRAPAPTPRASIVEGNGGPPKKERLDWDSMLEESRKQKTG